MPVILSTSGSALPIIPKWTLVANINVQTRCAQHFRPHLVRSLLLNLSLHDLRILQGFSHSTFTIEHLLHVLVDIHAHFLCAQRPYKARVRFWFDFKKLYTSIYDCHQIGPARCSARSRRCGIHSPPRDASRILSYRKASSLRVLRTQIRLSLCALLSYRVIWPG